MSTLGRIKYSAPPLPEVSLDSGFKVVDDAWGKTVRYSDLPGLAAAILWAIVTKQARLSGAEIAFLRRKLDQSQANCAVLIGVEEQTLSLWERGRHPIPISTDALFRRICYEELKSALPRKSRIPRTAEFVRLATPVLQGEYLASYGNDAWIVCYQPIQLTARSVSSTKVIALSVRKRRPLRTMVHASLVGSGGSFDFTDVSGLSKNAAIEISTGTQCVYHRESLYDKEVGKPIRDVTGASVVGARNYVVVTQ